MAITTLSGAISGMTPPIDFTKLFSGTAVAGRPFSSWYWVGRPVAGVAPTPGIGGEVLTTATGQIPFTNPLSGNSYLSRLQGSSNQSGSLWLCDRLWQNSGINVTLTTEQTFTASAQIPARDRDGTTTGNGVYAAVEVSTVVGAATPTLTVKYTNQAGVAGQTGTNMVAVGSASIAASFYPIGLANGDTGVQKAESITLSASLISGTIHVVLFRVIAMVDIQLQNITNAVDALTACFPRMYDNSVPFLVWVPTGSTASISGHVIISQG